jgi:acetyl-CoA/propionyl-CoA carboxylase biotin carboxyl carrier protein
VAEGDLVIVLEAMKMEQPLKAHRAGVISGINVEVGATISAGTKLLDILD